MPRAFALFLVMLLAAPALAAPGTSPEQMRKAKELFEKGQAAYNAGDYDKALENYRAAHDAAPLPALLFNIGQAYRLKGDKRHAVDYYQAYLKAQPGGPGAVEAQSHLQVLGRDLDAEDAAAREKAAAEERARAVEEARKKERETALAEAAARPRAEEPAPKSGRGLKIAGLVTGGAGIVLIGTGVYFGLRAKSLSNDLENLGADAEWDPSVVDDGEAANRNMLICTIAGGAALATGGVLYYLGMRTDSESKVAVAPIVGSGAGGLLVRGRW